VNTLLKTYSQIPVVYAVIVFCQLKRFRPGHRVFCCRERIRNDEKGEAQKNTALQIEAAVAGLCKGKLYPRITARRHKACGLAPAPAIRTYIADKTD